MSDQTGPINRLPGPRGPGGQKGCSVYTYANSIIVIRKSPATFRHRAALHGDGFQWHETRWERRYDNNTYFRWSNIMRREPDAGDWPVRRVQNY